jgi:CheY-like chemotaxis protein/HPt (histidine-containing phosphotransfer) domain-containing protein
MQVSSALGRGSTFSFEIPLNTVKNIENVNHLGQSAQQLSPVIKSNCKLLVVEDNDINRKVVGAMLSRDGYTFNMVENGLMALDAITYGERPSLVLMDCKMPVMDGFEATWQIRQWERLNNAPRIPIIALTAGAFQDDRERCIAAGMDDFLTKPIDALLLSATLSRWLDANSKQSVQCVGNELGHSKQVVFEKQSLLNRCDQDASLAAMIVEVFLSDHQNTLTELEQAVSNNDATNACLHAHSLKGSSSNVSGVQVAELAKMIELAAAEDDLDQVKSLMPSLIEATRILRSELSDFFDYSSV